MFAKKNGKVALVASAIAVLVVSSWGASAWGRSLAEIKRTKEARVCTASSIEFMNEFSRQQTTLFFNTIDKDIKITFKQYKWDEMFHNADGVTVREAAYTPKLLATEECDLYPSNLSVVEWRKSKMDFAVQYVNRWLVMVNKADKQKYKNQDDLPGKFAAVSEGTSYHSWLEGQNNAKFADNPVKLKLMDTLDALAEVNTGKVDFTLYDGMYSMWASKTKFQNTVGAFAVGENLDQAGWAVRKGEDDLRIAIETFFNEQRSDKNSPLNQLWKENLRITLTDFNTLMTWVK